MFHLQAYEEDLGTVTNSDLDAVPDTIFLARNDHFIYTDDWKMVLAYYLAPSALRVRTNVPKLNAYNRHHVFGVNRSATNPSPLNLQDMRREPMQLPKNEEFAWESTTDGPAMGTESNKVVQAIIPPNWTLDLPPHVQRLTVRATASAAGTIVAWGADAAITLADQDLRGGVYSMIGCQVFDAGTIAYRWIFPRQPESQGRQLRPGGLCVEAINNIPQDIFSAGLGEWGRFHTFELPRIQIFANATAASTQEIRMDLLYLGESEELLKDTM